MKKLLKRNIALFVCILSIVSFSISTFAFDSSVPVLTYTLTDNDFLDRIYTYQPTSHYLVANSSLTITDENINSNWNIPAGNLFVVNLLLSSPVTGKFLVYKPNVGLVDSKIINYATNCPQYRMSPISSSGQFIVTFRPDNDTYIERHDVIIYKP